MTNFNKIAYNSENIKYPYNQIKKTAFIENIDLCIPLYTAVFIAYTFSILVITIRVPWKFQEYKYNNLYIYIYVLKEATTINDFLLSKTSDKIFEPVKLFRPKNCMRKCIISMFKVRYLFV